jgi:hypothetical protein
MQADPGLVYTVPKTIHCMRPECVELRDCAHRDAGRPCWSAMGKIVEVAAPDVVYPAAPVPSMAQTRNDLLLDTQPEQEWTYVDLIERW